jgi:hypothetical protein
MSPDAFAPVRGHVSGIALPPMRVTRDLLAVVDDWVGLLVAGTVGTYGTASGFYSFEAANGGRTLIEPETINEHPEWFDQCGESPLT